MRWTYIAFGLFMVLDSPMAMAQTDGKGQVPSSQVEKKPEGSGAPENNDPQWGGTPPLEGYATVLNGLNKITARVFSMESKHGQPVKFGTLRIIVRGCRKNPPEEQPESAAFLEIYEEKTGEEPQPLFSGWMFSSSPAVSALEHPVYDIWVTDCLTHGETLKK